MPDVSPVTSSKLPRAVRFLDAFEEWIQGGHFRIRDANTNALVSIQLNQLQRELLDRMKELARAGKPLWFICLKGRKMGLSTFLQALLSFACEYFKNWSSMTLAHTASETKALFEISRRSLRNDERFTPVERRKMARGTVIRYHDTDSTYACRTGAGQYVLSGDTFNAMHISELSKWQGSEQDVSDAMLSILNSVLDSAFSMVFIESTANQSDTSGEYERRWRWASAGHGEFTAFFCPWFKEPRYQRVPPADFVPDDEEKGLVEKFGLNPGQLCWRRWQIATKFNGDAIRFRQEYPSTADEAFQISRGKIFPMLTAGKHVWRPTTSELLVGGYSFYCGIDFGGNDPFVCALVAHLDGKPGFTIDDVACAEAWREFVSYQRDAHGRPQDRDNHVPDAVRYVVQTMNLDGHLHLHRLLYVPRMAHRGKSVVDMAVEIQKMTDGLPVDAFVCDRSRPDSIVLLAQQGIPAVANKHPDTIRLGEIEDGLQRLTAMMLATVPLFHPPAPKPRVQAVYEQRAKREFESGMVFSDLSVAVSMYRDDVVSDSSDEIFGGAFR